MALKTTMPKIKIITGKGGVGKSSFAAALAHAYARRGQKTLLIELGPESFFSHVYKKNIQFKPTPLAPCLYASCWSGLECLEEYCQHLIKLPYISHILFNNKVMRHFFHTAPGLKELAVLGKLTSSLRHTGPSLNFEVLILDAYATGHFLSLVQAPASIAQLITRGPVGQQGRHIDQILKSPATEYYILSLADSLVATESFQLQQQLQSLGIKSQLLPNKWLPNVDIIDNTHAHFLGHKLKQQNLWLQQYNNTNRHSAPSEPLSSTPNNKNFGEQNNRHQTNSMPKHNLQTLPFCFSLDFKHIVQQMSQYIYENKFF